MPDEEIRVGLIGAGRNTRERHIPGFNKIGGLEIAAVAGTSFGAYGEGYMRFSYANSSQNIKRAMARIRERGVAEGWGQT